MADDEELKDWHEFMAREKRREEEFHATYADPPELSDHSPGEMTSCTKCKSQEIIGKEHDPLYHVLADQPEVGEVDFRPIFWLFICTKCGFTETYTDLQNGGDALIYEANNRHLEGFPDKAYWVNRPIGWNQK